ncbi:MAG: hypothetical protein EP329_19920 [Deltaproteobacteria bacterium]|nr:MAG: hypothetical protein EP329_19920 [Deltaproteobacteria bacterium]
MKWNELEAGLRAHAPLGTLDTYGEVRDSEGRYPLLRFRTPGSRPCVITAGWHGDEQSGPISLLEHLPEVVDHARAHDVALTVYPCLNPSGFDAFSRYNRNGERPNNWLIDYELPDGRVVGELRTVVPYTRTLLRTVGPAETLAILAELERLPTAPIGALDLHQDPYFDGHLAYAYAFGDPAPYIALIAETERIVPIARSHEVDDHTFSDEHGLVYLHDGSITDYFVRRGTLYNAVVETTTDTDMTLACQVNRVWMRGFIDLCARH